MRLRKLIALLLLSLLVLTAIPTAYAAENTTEFMGGDGTEVNPYLIANKTHLDNVRLYPDAHFLLLRDISFTEADFAEGGSFCNDGSGWVAIGTEDAPFTGVFNGGGHSISGLQITIDDSSSRCYTGLFGYNGGTVTDVHMTDGSIQLEVYSSSALTYAGGIAGFNTGTIRDCSSSIVIYSYAHYGTGGYSASAYAGGIAGQNEGTVTGCWNTGSVEAHASTQQRNSGAYAYAGGIAGRNKGTVSTCFSTSSVYAHSTTYYSGSSSSTCPPARGYAGGIAGYSDSGSIFQCYNSGSVRGSATPQYKPKTSSYEAYSGGIAGYLNSGELRDCLNMGETTASAYFYCWAGGIVGYCNGTLGTCYNLGSSAASWKYGPILGATGRSASGPEHCYYAFTPDGGEGTSVMLPDMLNRETFAGFDFETAWVMDETGSFPLPVPAGVTPPAADSAENTTEFDGGRGTMWDPYRITTVQHLKNAVSYPNASFKLMNDLDFAGETDEWIPIGSEANPFTGVFFGGGHTISGLQLTTARSNGLFGHSEGYIFDVHMKDGSLSSSASVSGNIVAYNAGVVMRCSNSNTSIGPNTGGRDMGGLVGANTGLISQCFNSGFIRVAYKGEAAAGIAGTSSGDIRDCYNTGEISTSNAGNYPYVGGIVGAAANEGPIVDCYNIGTIGRSWYNYSGGIGGRCYSAVNCYYLAQESGSSSTSGTACTEAQMQLPDTYQGFDFENVWCFDAFGDYAYPRLRWEFADSYTLSIVAETNVPLETVEGLWPELSGITVRATYPNGTTRDLPLTATMLSGLDISQVGTHTVYPESAGVVSADPVTITVKEKSPISIEITTMPSKTEYEKNVDELYTQDARLTVTYDNGTTERVMVTEDLVSGFDNTVGGKQTLTVTYLGLTTSLEVLIYEAEWLEIRGLPLKTTFVQGQPVDARGIRASLHYTNGRVLNVVYYEVTLSYDEQAIGAVPVTVSYLGVEATYDITVTERVVKSITLTDPEKVVYYQSEPLVLTGGSVIATFVSDDNYQETIPLDESMVSGYDPAIAGFQEVTVTYQGATASFLVRVKPIVYGDVDGDGDADSKDRSILARYLAGWEGYTADIIIAPNADVTCDGAVNGKDRTVLARHLAGWEGYVTLPLAE